MFADSSPIGSLCLFLSNGLRPCRQPPFDHRIPHFLSDPPWPIVVVVVVVVIFVVVVVVVVPALLSNTSRKESVEGCHYLGSSGVNDAHLQAHLQHETDRVGAGGGGRGRRGRLAPPRAPQKIVELACKESQVDHEACHV